MSNSVLNLLCATRPDINIETARIHAAELIAKS